MSFEKQARAVEGRAFELTTKRTGGLALDALGLIEAVLERTQGMILTAMGVDVDRIAQRSKALYAATGEGDSDEMAVIARCVVQPLLEALTGDAVHLVPSCDPGRPASPAHACPHGVCGGKCCPLPPADAVEDAARSMLQVQEVFPGAAAQTLAWQDMGNGDWMLWGLPLGVSSAVYAPDDEQPEHGYEVGQREDVLAQGVAPSLEEARLQCMRATARVLARLAQEAEQVAMVLGRGVL